MNKLQSCVKIAAISVATIVSLTQPAKAVLFNTFEFTNENGYGAIGGTVEGTITFDSLDSTFSGSGVLADSIVIDSAPSAVFDGNDIEIGVNILDLGFSNIEQSFNISNGIIQVSGTDVEISNFSTPGENEWFCLNSDASLN